MNNLTDITEFGHLGKRHMDLSGSTRSRAVGYVEAAERSNHRAWTSPDYRDSSRPRLDFLDGISGDDLARLRVGKPAREPKLWDDLSARSIKDRLRARRAAA